MADELPVMKRMPTDASSAKAVSGWLLRTSKLQVRLHTSRNYGYRDGFDGRHEMALM